MSSSRLFLPIPSPLLPLLSRPQSFSSPSLPSPQVLAQYHPMALRWFLLSTHYRSPINYSAHQLAAASDRLYSLYQVKRDVL